LPVAALPPGAPAFIQTPPYPAGSPAAPAQPAIKAKLPPAPAGPIHKRRTLLWLILLMVALGVAAMAIAYYWPSSSL
jgi:hypothetical protein